MGVDFYIYTKDPNTVNDREDLYTEGHINCFQQLKSYLFRYNEIIHDLFDEYMDKPIYYDDIKKMLDILLTKLNDNPYDQYIGEAIMLCCYIIKEYSFPIWAEYST